MDPKLVLSMTQKSIGEETCLSFTGLWNEGSNRFVLSPIFTEFPMTSDLPILRPVTGQQDSSVFTLTASSSEMPWHLHVYSNPIIKILFIDLMCESEYCVENCTKIIVPIYWHIIFLKQWWSSHYKPYMINDWINHIYVFQFSVWRLPKLEY